MHNSDHIHQIKIFPPRDKSPAAHSALPELPDAVMHNPPLFFTDVLPKNLSILVRGYKDMAPDPANAWTSGRKIGKKIFTDLKQAARPGREGIDMHQYIRICALLVLLAVVLPATVHRRTTA